MDLKYNIKEFLGSFFLYKSETDKYLEEYFEKKLRYENGRLIFDEYEEIE